MNNFRGRLLFEISLESADAVCPQHSTHNWAELDFVQAINEKNQIDHERAGPGQQQRIFDKLT